MARPDEAAVRRALDTVIDPCSVAAGVPAGLDSMGLVRTIDVIDRAGGATVRVALALTEPSCLMGPSFLVSARETLLGLDGVSHVEVCLDDAEWAPEDMDPRYARRLATARRIRRRRFEQRQEAKGTSAA